MKIIFSLLITTSFLLGGCSDDKSTSVKDDASFSGMVDSEIKAMQKTKALEGVLQDAEKMRREESGQ